MRLYQYTTERGLHSLELICNLFRYKTWLLPSLVCDEVVQAVKAVVPDEKVRFYSIGDNFKPDLDYVVTDTVFYSIDYFGYEQEFLTEVVHIRDGVWFPNILRPLRRNEIWFNSFRKIDRNAKGSLILSPVDLGLSAPGSGEDYQVSINWSVRWKNYFFLKGQLNDYSINYTPQFPSLFPVRLKNRDEVLPKLGITLPGMWQGRLAPPHSLYKELTFIPIDERFNETNLKELSDKIKSLT